MSISYTPNLADAAQDAFAGQAFDDPGSSVYASADPARVDAKFFLKPVQDEVLALAAGRVASGTYRQTWTCVSGLAVGDPVYVSANDTVTKADATDTTKSKVIGFVRYKPTTTTCYIEHFRYVSGLSGGTAGAAVYLTDAGGFSASAGTVAKIVGQWITATEALLNATQHSALTSGVAGGTASFVPKFTGANTLGLSAYGDDGTCGVLFKIASATVSDANSLLKWRGTTVPAAFLASSGGGVPILVRAQDAASGSASNGADIVFMPGAKDGAGTNGKFIVRQPSGTPGTHEIQFSHNGTNAGIIPKAGVLWIGEPDGSDSKTLRAVALVAGGGNGHVSINYYSSHIKLGAAHPLQWSNTSNDASAATDLSLARDAANIFRFSTSGVTDAVTRLKLSLSGSAPAAYTAAADTSGLDAIFRCQGGGAHSAANPSGAGFHVVLGAKGSGGSGAAGQFRVYESAASAYAYFDYTSTSHMYLGTSSGKSLIIEPNSSVVFRTAALATSATDGDIYIPSSAGKPTGTPTAYTGTVPIRADTTNHVVWGYLNSQWAQIGGAAWLLPNSCQRNSNQYFNPNNNITVTNDTAYWVYVGYTLKPVTIAFVEFNVSTGGTGAQTAEVALASSPAAPNKANQTLTKLTATGTVDDLTTTGRKRNTSSLAYACAAGVHLWAGIRTAMATTQPAMNGICGSFDQGMFTTTATAGALTGAGPWTGTKTTHNVSAAEVPKLVVTLD